MNPLKQGLKPLTASDSLVMPSVFIHESIKTRVETRLFLAQDFQIQASLSMNPLKQGLKHEQDKIIRPISVWSLSMNPLKQGLKPPVCSR